MSTNRDIVKAALQMLSVLDADENPSAEDGKLGLRQLNNLFASLTADGIDLGFPPQDDLSETFPLDGTVEAQIEPLLAVKLQPLYPSAQLSAATIGEAMRAMDQLKRDTVLNTMEESSLKHLPRGEANVCIYDIDNDQ